METNVSICFHMFHVAFCMTYICFMYWVVGLTRNISCEVVTLACAYGVFKNHKICSEVCLCRFHISRLVFVCVCCEMVVFTLRTQAAIVENSAICVSLRCCDWDVPIQASRSQVCFYVFVAVKCLLFTIQRHTPMVKRNAVCSYGIVVSLCESKSL